MLIKSDYLSGEQLAAVDFNHVAERINSFGQEITFTQTIPFTFSHAIVKKNVDAAYTFTPDTTSAVKGNGVEMVLIADGVNVPSFSGFEKLSSSANYVNEQGRENIIIFYLNAAGHYVYSILIGGVYDSIAPVIISAVTATTTKILLTFNENVNVTTAGWTFKRNGTTMPIVGVTGSGNSRSFKVGFMSPGDAITYSYDPSTGNTTDSPGNELTSILDQIVTNNLTTNVAPTATGVGMSGLSYEGQTLTGVYTFADANGDEEGTSLKKWYRSDDNAGTNRIAISGATGSTYLLTSADLGKFIQFAVTPVATTGVPQSGEYSSAYSEQISVPPATVVWTSLQNTTDQGNGTIKGTGSSMPAGGLATQHIAGNGFAEFTFNNTTSAACVLELMASGDTNYAYGASYSLIKAGIYVYGGNIYYDESSNGASISLGDVGNYTILRIQRVGNDIIYKASVSGSSYVTLLTRTGAVSGVSDLYIKAVMASNTATSNLINVRATGLV